jgi:hypothetical protein
MAGEHCRGTRGPIRRQAQKVEIGMEITDFHVAPGRHLMIRLPLELNVTQGP